jgi:hypothetical protein
MHRKDFDNRFVEYREFLRDEIHHYLDFLNVFHQIQERKSDKLDILNLAPGFFGAVERALFTGIVLWADKLLDEKGERGFFNFLVFVEHNRKWLTVGELKRRRNYPDDHWMLNGRIPITVESIKKDRQKIFSLEVMKSIRTQRDKFHGHFDKDYAFAPERLHLDAPIKWAGLEEAGKIMGSILNAYSADFDGNLYSWNTLNIDDLDVLLQFAKRGIQSNTACHESDRR